GEWTVTGDKYHLDTDGYYTYEGRADDMLKVSGQWVSPAEVEAALMEHPAVLECGVVGAKDKDELTKPRAFVLLKQGQRPSDALAEELKQFVKTRIAPYKYPRWIDFVDELPKTATGKIQRWRLRELGGGSEDHMGALNPKVAAWKRAAAEDPEGFWGRAAEELPWFRRWERVLDWEPPTFRWYRGGLSNLAYNCVDHHVKSGAGSLAALITESERGEQRTYTYAQLHEETRRVGAALRGLGIKKGDRIAIYMPTCAEAIVLMLGAVRIGAVIIVVFAGFGAGALGERIRLAGARAVFATDVTYRKGKDVPLKQIVDDAVAGSPTVERVVVLKRGSAAVAMTAGRDITWD